MNVVVHVIIVLRVNGYKLYTMPVQSHYQF